MPILTVVMKVRWEVWENYRKYIMAALMAAGVLLFLKYLLPYVLPFLIAMCLVAVMYPFLEKTERRFHIRKGMTAGLILVVCLILIGTVIWCLWIFVCERVRMLLQNRMVMEECFCDFVRNCCGMLETNFGVESRVMEQMALDRIDEIGRNLQIQIVPKFMNRSFAYLKAVTSIFTFWAVTLIASILLAKDYYRIRQKLRGYKTFRTAAQIGTEIGRMVLGYLKAQAIILCTISVICVAGLWACGMEGFLTLGIVAGLMDALPFIGTGIVLVPTALWQLIQGNLWRMAAVFAIYGVCALAREFLEPKLLGKRMGIYPVFMLLAIYAGVKFYGLSGVVLGPLSCLLIRELYGRMKGIKQKQN